MSTLLNKRAELFNAMKALNDTIVTRSLKGENCNEEKGKYTELEAQYESLNAEIGRQEKFRSFEDSINKAIDNREVATGADEAKVRSAFINYCRSGDASELRSMNTFSTTEGAALVGQTMYGQIVDVLRTETVIRKLPGIEVIRTTNTNKISVAASDVVFGAVAQGPSGSYNTSEMTFGQLSLEAYKFGGVVKVSDELLQDASYDVAGHLTRAIAGAQAVAEEALFVSGSGSSTVKGLLKYTTGATDTTINSGSVADGLIDASFASANLRNNGVYIMGPGLAKAARKIKSSEGDYLWTPSLVEGKPDMFNGRPVYVTDAAPSTLAAGTVAGVYVDPRAITIGDRLPLQILRLSELFATEGFVGFRYTFRTDMVIKNVDKTLNRLIWG